jgi:hypothetical protein
LLATTAKHGGVLAYGGPRLESFRQCFATDVELLRSAAAGQSLAVGDFLFALEAAGPRYDGLLRVGEGSFLVCNHTQKTMMEIRAKCRRLKQRHDLRLQVRDSSAFRPGQLVDAVAVDALHGLYALNGPQPRPRHA